MAFRLYLVPKIGTGTSLDPWRVKYFDGFGIRPNAMHYGFQPVFLVAADLTPVQDASLVANPDAYGFPFDLTPQLSAGQANDATAALESYYIAAHWVNASITWLTVARTTCGIFQYMQRLYGVIGPVLLLDGTSNKNLNTQWNQIPANIQQGILTAAHSLGYDTSFIQNNTQVRAFFKAFGDMWGLKPFEFGPFVI